MECKVCGASMPDAKKVCTNCGAFLEGYTLNNVTGEFGYRGGDGLFYKDEAEYKNKSLGHDKVLTMDEEMKQGLTRFYIGLKSDVENGEAPKFFGVKVGNLDSLSLREHLGECDKIGPGEWKAPGSLSFTVELGKSKWREMRKRLFGKKSRLPRKLKKAARHLQVKAIYADPMPNQGQGQANSEQVFSGIAIIRIVGRYPRTKWVNRAIAKIKRQLPSSIWYQKMIKNE